MENYYAVQTSSFDGLKQLRLVPRSGMQQFFPGQHLIDTQGFNRSKIVDIEVLAVVQADVEQAHPLVLNEELVPNVFSEVMEV